MSRIEIPLSKLQSNPKILRTKSFTFQMGVDLLYGKAIHFIEYKKQAIFELEDRLKTMKNFSEIRPKVFYHFTFEDIQSDRLNLSCILEALIGIPNLIAFASRLIKKDPHYFLVYLNLDIILNREISHPIFQHERDRIIFLKTLCREILIHPLFQECAYYKDASCIFIPRELAEKYAQKESVAHAILFSATEQRPHEPEPTALPVPVHYEQPACRASFFACYQPTQRAEAERKRWEEQNSHKPLSYQPTQRIEAKNKNRGAPPYAIDYEQELVASP